MTVTKNEIGFNAGNILNLLTIRGRLSLRQIGEMTHYKDVSITMAIGWLLREGKVLVYNEDGKLYFDLNRSVSEIYY
ncbi:winged helix-turn-helix domain-containing protein [Dysgonomonas sp. 25]|uniref:winged helix-turn-helix domain-containing protein n=1 Tax=Dysgonomonas sp. 25 TaxID=2302933 RepID=UPI0013D22D5B|nr:winged helix-turn-helix domain-containing protein [Dysgonomonas sp. 25]NDV68208.1 hypothetical protein [Dysgonomonas sp. 25]